MQPGAGLEGGPGHYPFPNAGALSGMGTEGHGRRKGLWGRRRRAERGRGRWRGAGGGGNGGTRRDWAGNARQGECRNAAVGGLTRKGRPPRGAPQAWRAYPKRRQLPRVGNQGRRPGRDWGKLHRPVITNSPVPRRNQDGIGRGTRPGCSLRRGWHEKEAKKTYGVK